MYKNFFIDNDFDINKSYIYAIASIDAHGLLSNYSEQVRYNFDARKRVLVKELVSIENAPRQMPNYFLENQLVNLSIGDSNSKSAMVYLDPDYLKLKYEDQDIDIFPTNAEYRLQFLNLDLQQVQNLNIVIKNAISNELMKAI
jgi:ribosomal protein S17E